MSVRQLLQGNTIGSRVRSRRRRQRSIENETISLMQLSDRPLQSSDAKSTRGRRKRPSGTADAPTLHDGGALVSRSRVAVNENQIPRRSSRKRPSGSIAAPALHDRAEPLQQCGDSSSQRTHSCKSATKRTTRFCSST